MTPAEMETRIVRYGDLQPCKTAFIDAHTPGSNQKENFTIIGGGVSESPDQHVHISIPHGFNIGTDYGMIMAILGGDDAGGGVMWAPQVIENAADHGLILGENGKLYDTKRQQKLPEGVAPMPLMSDEELAKRPEPTTTDVLPNHVARYWDLMALADKKPAKVIGENGILRDKPGFEVDFITRGSASDAKHSHKYPSILMPMRGHWKVTWDGGSSTLAPGDTMSVPENLPHSAVPSMTGEASLYHIVATGDPAGPSWKG